MSGGGDCFAGAFDGNADGEGAGGGGGGAGGGDSVLVTSRPTGRVGTACTRSTGPGADTAGRGLILPLGFGLRFSAARRGLRGFRGFLAVLTHLAASDYVRVLTRVANGGFTHGRCDCAKKQTTEAWCPGHLKSAIENCGFQRLIAFRTPTSLTQEGGDAGPLPHFLRAAPELVAPPIFSPDTTPSLIRALVVLAGATAVSGQAPDDPYEAKRLDRQPVPIKRGNPGDHPAGD